MEYTDFKRLIDSLAARPVETEWIEFKHNFHSKEEIGERLSALANSARLRNASYAYLVFGIDDTTHGVVGTDMYGKRKMVGNEELESWLSTRLNPRIDFDIIDEWNYEDKGHVCVFRIPAAVDRPVTFLNEGYVRVGSITRKLKDFPDKEAKIWKGGQKPLESIVVRHGLTAQDVVQKLSAETYFDLLHLPMPQTTEGIIERLMAEKMVVADEVGYGITYLGAVLIAKRLSDFDNLGRKAVRVIVYKGKNKISTEREQIFDTGYAVSFPAMLTWIEGQLPANEVIGLALRTDARMYPALAIREVVANMIIHQDFGEQGFPMIEIFTDRISISNPGLPLISPERFIDEYQSRNDSLADVMRRMGICEEKGSGMDKAIDAIERYQLPALNIVLQENRTCVTLYAYKRFADTNRQERIAICYQHACLKYLSSDKMTNQSLRDRLGIDNKNYPMASRIIKEALSENLIKDADPDNRSKKMSGYIPYWG